LFYSKPLGEANLKQDYRNIGVTDLTPLLWQVAMREGFRQHAGNTESLVYFQMLTSRFLVATLPF
jgi:hypothetical protein